MIKVHQLSARDPISGSSLPDGSLPVADGAGLYGLSSSSTTSILLPSGTTAQRPVVAAANRAIRFNTTAQALEFWDGSAWAFIPKSGLENWTLPGSYSSGQIVAYDGQLYSANADIPANTAFSTGTTGATFSPLIGTTETWTGVYAPATTYGIGDVVGDGSGNLYVSKISPNTGNALTDFTAWEPYSPYVDLSMVMAVMTGANGVLAGKKGMVPAPAATDNTKFLRGDGTWAVASGGSSLTEITETFTATAGQWQFTLSQTPNATDLPNLNFCVNGLCGKYGAGTYITLSGITLSWQSGATGYNLVAGDKVVVTYKY